MVINLDTGLTVVHRLNKADTFWKRFWGLLLHKSLPVDEGILLTPCTSIHTFFMRFKIDVVFLDDSMNILAVHKEVKPWRVIAGPKGSKHVLELATGVLSKADIKVSHRLQM